EKVGEEIARQMEVFVYLNTIDTLWIEHLDTMDDLRSGIGLRGYAQRDPLIEYKREGFELFEKLMVTIDYEIVHRIYKVAVQGETPRPEPIRVEEKHPEIEVGVREEAAEVSKLSPTETGAKVKVERPDDLVIKEETVPPVLPSGYGGTKVTIERGGEVIAEETYGDQGQLTKSHGKIGRNDPCWCGSGKKYKKCHYPN
ncbi:MAG: SEC-C metal-binding domain-containing protein, partial [Candidatus Daviesbacteria bacterium]|nr:SEC-C metal-binding domain-containing protein [Candidatus Daviesbacteria bacterium]